MFSISPALKACDEPGWIAFQVGTVQCKPEGINPVLYNVFVFIFPEMRVVIKITRQEQLICCFSHKLLSDTCKHRDNSFVFIF